MCVFIIEELKNVIGNLKKWSFNCCILKNLFYETLTKKREYGF